MLNIVFKIADDNDMLLLDLKDLRAMLQCLGDNSSEFTTRYGNVSAASVAAIQCGLLQIESQGADKFFGEPMPNINDLMQNTDGQGVIIILAADKLMNAPRPNATFVLWMLSELIEQLPEVGDLEHPKLVFFFDEAHLLFNEAPKVLVEVIELIVRRVRSKGVDVYFVSQNPLDITDSVLAQLGNRVQHALRAFTPGEQKPSRRPYKPCAKSMGCTLKPPSPNWPWARRWSACWMPKAGPARLSAYRCFRRVARLDPSPSNGDKPYCKTR